MLTAPTNMPEALKVAHLVQQWQLYEHDGNGGRHVVEDAPVLEMTAPEAAEMNRRLVFTMCRVYPVSDTMLP